MHFSQYNDDTYVVYTLMIFQYIPPHNTENV